MIKLILIVLVGLASLKAADPSVIIVNVNSRHPMRFLMDKNTPPWVQVEIHDESPKDVYLLTILYRDMGGMDAKANMVCLAMPKPITLCFFIGIDALETEITAIVESRTFNEVLIIK